LKFRKKNQQIRTKRNGEFKQKQQQEK